MILTALLLSAIGATPITLKGSDRAVSLVQDTAVQPPANAKFYEEPAPPGFARIHLISDDPAVRLFRETEARDKEGRGGLPGLLLRDEVICTAPCGTLVDIRPGQNVYLGGPGMPSTPKFNLVGRSGDVVINVHGGSYAQLILGHIGSWGGFIGALASGSLLVVGLLLRPAADPFLRTTGNLLTVGGGIGLGVGLVFGVTGLYLVHAGTTRYDVLPSGTRPPHDVPATLEL